MKKEIKIARYHKSQLKRLFNFLSAFLLIIFLSPLIIIITLLLKSKNGGPIFFKQKRAGKDAKPFTIYKFRTMKAGSEGLQSKFKKLNEADGPVFKIRNDPRLTKIGMFLYQTGLDEIPQFINILKGEMNIVGPRPLPLYEERKLTKLQKFRELVKPGITSEWVICGSHSLGFKKWMDLDKKYIISGSIFNDITIIFKTFLLIARGIVSKIL